MWFLKGRPTEVKVQAFIASKSGGYQQNSYRFTIEATPESTKDGKIWIGIAFPWSPHKPKGSFSIVQDDLLGWEESTNVLSEEDVTVIERLRSLKTEPDIELVLVQDLLQWYIEDVGLIMAWVESGKAYQLNYMHKIAADSKLFFPTRLPIITASVHKPKMDYKLWVRDGGFAENKALVKSSTGRSDLQCWTFNEWDWDDDTRVTTENWDSSDDIQGSSEEAE